MKRRIAKKILKRRTVRNFLDRSRGRYTYEQRRKALKRVGLPTYAIGVDWGVDETDLVTCRILTPEGILVSEEICRVIDREIIAELERAAEVSTSMGALVPRDKCSLCGHESGCDHVPADYGLKQWKDAELKDPHRSFISEYMGVFPDLGPYCKCGHAFDQHHKGGWCRMCTCEQFKERTDGSD